MSYNRPLTTRGTTPTNSVFNAEYPMVRWLESNGFNVSYISGIDTDRSGATILNATKHKAFLSVGHDEYWSAAQRANVETARAAGLSLAFFSGNEVFWKTRWEASIDGTATAFRTLVSYKETHANADIDPTSAWTGTWRDPRFSPPTDGGRPENALTGTIFTVQCCQGQYPSIVVPPAAATHRFWRNSPIAASGGGVLGPLVSGVNVASGGILGYEFDEDLDNGFRPAGLAQLSSTTATVDEKVRDYGNTYGAGTATHSLTLYRHASGALVFGAGTIQWSWGLDNNHDRQPDGVTDYTNQSVRQGTVNLFGDMGAQPMTLQADLTPATPSADVVPPTSTITSPAERRADPVGDDGDDQRHGGRHQRRGGRRRSVHRRRGDLAARDGPAELDLFLAGGRDGRRGAQEPRDRRQRQHRHARHRHVGDAHLPVQPLESRDHDARDD